MTAIELLKQDLVKLDAEIESLRTRRAVVFTAVSVLEGTPIREAGKVERGKSVRNLVEEIIRALPAGCTFDYASIKQKSRDYPMDAERVCRGVYQVLPALVNKEIIKLVPGGYQLNEK